MDVDASFVADGETPEAIEPGKCAFDDPAIAAETFAGRCGELSRCLLGLDLLLGLPPRRRVPSEGSGVCPQDGGQGGWPSGLGFGGVRLLRGWRGGTTRRTLHPESGRITRPGEWDRRSGWGTWIRTKAARVRAGSSTAKLSPKRAPKRAGRRPDSMRPPAGQPGSPAPRRSSAPSAASSELTA